MLTDKIGRKPTFLIANFLMVIGGLLAAISPEFYTFVAARVFTGEYEHRTQNQTNNIFLGFAVAGLEASTFVMGMELVGRKHMILILLINPTKSPLSNA